MLPVLRRMQEEPEGAWSREGLARLVHLSPSRFHALFKEAMGQAPLAYLQELRLRRAQERLVASEAGVAEIGRACGFGDPFHFSRQFKAFCGESPRTYRVNRRGELS